MSAGHNKAYKGLGFFSSVRRIRTYVYQLGIANAIMQLIQLVTCEAHPTPPTSTSFREHITSLITKIKF